MKGRVDTGTGLLGFCRRWSNSGYSYGRDSDAIERAGKCTRTDRSGGRHFQQAGYQRTKKAAPSAIIPSLKCLTSCKRRLRKPLICTNKCTMGRAMPAVIAELCRRTPLHGLSRLFSLLQEANADNDITVSIHNQETEHEGHFFPQNRRWLRRILAKSFGFRSTILKLRAKPPSTTPCSR